MAHVVHGAKATLSAQDERYTGGPSPGPGRRALLLTSLPVDLNGLTTTFLFEPEISESSNSDAMKTGHNNHRSVEQARQDEEETTNTMSNVGFVLWKASMVPPSISVLPHKKRIAFTFCFPRSFAMVIL